MTNKTRLNKARRAAGRAKRIMSRASGKIGSLNHRATGLLRDKPMFAMLTAIAVGYMVARVGARL